ncbi:MAG: riboflavin synthase [bacterium]|nr:riboflavin synthase [bacterium]
MFTGITEEIGKIIQRRGDGFKIQAEIILEDIKVGDSILVNGVCLTVVKFDKGSFDVDVMPETIHVTNLKLLKAGDRVNLERALRINDRLGGHIVTGHIDATSQLKNKKYIENSCLMEFEIPEAISKYLIKRGSIAVNGVSLTIVELDRNKFKVSLIPHTMKLTNLGELNLGGLVNIEADVIGKYVARLTNGNIQEEISYNTLAKHGFA